MIQVDTLCRKIPNFMLAWKEQGILTIAGYILGFPADTPETIRRDIAIIKDELPIDLLEFFCLTPLPGSEDHQVLWKNRCPATLSCSSSNGQCRRVRRRIY